MIVLKSLKRTRSKTLLTRGQTKEKKRAMSAAGAAFLVLGLVGVAVFGYLVFRSGGINGLIGMADGIGLIVSLVVLVAGFYMK